MTVPAWLVWAREIQAIAQTGLAYGPNQYDGERYEALQTLAARIAAAHTAEPVERLEQLFTAQTGYATPKTDVRGAAFDAQGHLLMVREKADADRWTLPGGWADVNLTAAENVVKEVREESGLQTRVRKLAAVWDRNRQGHRTDFFSCYKLFFICDVTGGEARPGPETTGIGWFARDALPGDLSQSRVLPQQLDRMFEHAADPLLPADFD